MMETIKFECEVITPMFLGGADGKSAELRAPSIKGALRFWWRAMNGHLPLKELHEREAEIFGGGGDNGRRSQVIIRVENSNLKFSKENFPNLSGIHLFPVPNKTFKMNILEYLAYGTHEPVKGQRVNFIREYIYPNQKFNISFIVPSNIKDELINSFHFLSFFNGLGARSRNGFGCLHIKIDETQIRSIISKIKENFIPELPSYTAFSKNFKIWKVKQPFPTWDKALAELGTIYKDCRTNLETPHKFSKRQYISAPIVEKKVTKSFLDRHSKQYFLSIHKERNSFTGYVLFLPSHFILGMQNEKDYFGEIIKDNIHTKEAIKVWKEMNSNLSKTMTEVII